MQPALRHGRALHSHADSPPDDHESDWPDDWRLPAGPAPGGPRRGRRIAVLALTALVARVGPEVSAKATSATQFTGSARSLAQVHVGDTVAVQIIDSTGAARVISLQDPATAS